MKDSIQKRQRDLIDPDYYIALIRRFWRQVMICAVLGVAIAFMVNFFTIPVYRVGSSILIRDDENGIPATSSSMLQGFGIIPTENRFQNELVILQSSPLIEATVSKMNIAVSYFNKRRFVTRELYKTSPFVVILNQSHPQLISHRFAIKIIDDQTFRISIRGTDLELYSFDSQKVMDIVPEIRYSDVTTFDSTITTEYFSFKVIRNENFDPADSRSGKLSFELHSLKNLIRRYKLTLDIAPDDIETSVAALTLESTVPLKDIDFLQSLSQSYLDRNQDKKNHISVKTIEYIDNQLNIISDSLRTAEENLQRYRTRNQVMDISLKTGRIYDQMSDLESQKAELMVKYKYYQYINDYFSKNKEVSEELIAPSSMGIDDPLLNNLIQELIQLNAERSRLIENNQEKSPYLRTLNIKIENLMNTISENIKYILNTAEISLQDINARIERLNFEVNKLPRTERELFGYERKFNLNDAIYTFLLEKRAEAQIAKASYLPDAEIIEPAGIMGSRPISPNKKLNLLLGLIFGLILPVAFIQAREILQNRISSRSDLERLTDVPVLGFVYKNNKAISNVVHSFPKSHIAESFRILRSGLDYFNNDKEKKTILITSTFGQEGKTFISVNLATSLALMKKRTVLVGFDLRKPMLFERLNLKNDNGLSSYLSGQEKLEKIIQKSGVENLDVITAGPIPPNPSELIASKKTDELLERLKEKYDYIFIDTPPIGILSDTYFLMDKADVNIYVVRENYTPKREFTTVINKLEEKNYKHLCIVYNDHQLVKKTRYGYDYYETK
ncbi:MAG TPA: polysaccharide biosynthesis tyrosine autokinase [Bacteroidales bacterium]|nr:polysaccharide biosynthesis tyrosine autokinase [Bacteroidales bacterium]